MWLQLHLTVDESQVPLVERLFEDLGAVAVTLNDAGNEPMLEPRPGETPLWQATRVTGLFDGEADADGLRTALNQALATDASRSLRFERLDDRDWARAWLERFRPMRFGDRLWIRPTGSQVTQPDAVIVDLDPGLAFGTGTHPTTALCLEWLDEHNLRDKTVIDFGCGSGILAIAAVKLGARHVVAVDHDPQALLAIRDNAARNQVDDRIEVLYSDDFGRSRAHVVVANILANVLIDLAPMMGQLVAPSGHLVMSGILAGQADSVAAAYESAFDIGAPRRRDSWVLLDGRRR